MKNETKLNITNLGLSLASLVGLFVSVRVLQHSFVHSLVLFGLLMSKFNNSLKLPVECVLAFEEPCAWDAVVLS